VGERSNKSRIKEERWKNLTAGEFLSISALDDSSCVYCRHQLLLTRGQSPTIESCEAETARPFVVQQGFLMNSRAELIAMIEALPDERVNQLFDFAKYLSWQQESRDWREFGKQQFAKAFGDDEPEYSEADVQTRPTP
jgi:hypothetical protein